MRPLVGADHWKPEPARQLPTSLQRGGVPGCCSCTNLTTKAPVWWGGLVRVLVILIDIYSSILVILA